MEIQSSTDGFGDTRRVEPHSIRSAELRDRAAILGMFEKFLPAHYEGDHVAHALRVFETHIGGGQDLHGHFSSAQKLLVADVDGRVAGLVNVVRKRQGTAKLSPIMVQPEFSRIGIGTQLLHAAGSVALGWGSRFTYATVAEQNHGMLSFLRHHGWVVAGSAQRQYHSIENELLLYQDVGSDKESDVHIRAMRGEDSAQVRNLVLSRLASHFDGVDDTFVDALLLSRERFGPDGISTKAKSIRVACTRDNEIVGLSAAGPKKGGSIKLFPLCASQSEVLDALVLDARTSFRSGRKLYTHQPPDPAITRSLQRSGWQAEGVIPSAYRADSCTIQWGFALDSIDDAYARHGDFSQYQSALRKVVSDRNWRELAGVRSLALALGGEIGELFQLVQWKGDDVVLEETRDVVKKTNFGHELADILNYTLRIADEVGIDILESAWEKLKIVAERYPVDMARGNTTKYTEWSSE